MIYCIPPLIKRSLTGILLILCMIFLIGYNAYAGTGLDDIMSLGVPFGGSESATEEDLKLSPASTRVIHLFLSAWKKNDYKTMYALIDDASKENYLFEQAKMDFQFQRFKPYKISSVRKNGENFDFILSYGDYKDNDKELKKMMVSGKTFKIMLFFGNTFFKRSISDCF